MSMIKRFNRVSNWATTEIVKVQNIKDRAQVLAKFIEIAAVCSVLCTVLLCLVLNLARL